MSFYCYRTLIGHQKKLYENDPLSFSPVTPRRNVDSHTWYKFGGFRYAPQIL